MRQGNEWSINRVSHCETLLHSAHADLEYMQEIRSELGSIPHTLQSLHEIIEHNDDNIGKYIHSYQHVT